MFPYPHFNSPLMPESHLNVLKTTLPHMSKPEISLLKLNMQKVGTSVNGNPPDNSPLSRSLWLQLKPIFIEYTNHLLRTFHQTLNVDFASGPDGITVKHVLFALPHYKTMSSLGNPNHIDSCQGIGVLALQPLVNPLGHVASEAETLVITPLEGRVMGRFPKQSASDDQTRIAYIPGHTLGFMESVDPSRYHPQVMHGVDESAPPVITENEQILMGWGGPNHTYYEKGLLKEDPLKVTRSIMSSFINSQV